MRAVISGYYGFGNFGDELILHVISQQFSRCGWTGTALSRHPAYTVATQGLNAAQRWDPLSIWHAMTQSDWLLSGGGGLLQDATSGRTARYYLEIIKLARQLRKKTLIWNQGLGPLDRPSVIREVLTVLQEVDHLWVRDERSLAWLTQRGVQPDRVHLGADPGWIYSWPALTGPPAEWSQWPKPIIGVCPRPHPTFIQALQGFLSSHHGTMVWLMAHSHFDRPLIDRIQHRLKVQWPVLDLNPPFRGCGLIHHLDGLISARYHPLLIAIRSGVRVFPVAVDPKILALFNDCSMPVIPEPLGVIPPLTEWPVYPGPISEKIFSLQQRARQSFHWMEIERAALS